jgi:hypothetical protein
MRGICHILGAFVATKWRKKDAKSWNLVIFRPIFAMSKRQKSININNSINFNKSDYEDK